MFAITASFLYNKNVINGDIISKVQNMKGKRFGRTIQKISGKTKQKKYAYFSFHECRNHPIDFDMMNSKGFLVRSAKGLNDCTGVYNNFTDLKGFFQFSLFFS